MNFAFDRFFGQHDGATRYLKKIPWKYCLYTLMLLYVAGIVTSVWRMRDMMTEVRLIERAGRETRETRTRLNEMQNIIPGILSMNGITRDDAEKELRKIEGEQDKAITRLGQMFPAERASVAAVENGIARIREAVRGLEGRLANNRNYLAAINGYRESVSPLVREVNESLNQISRNSDEKIMGLEQRFGKWLTFTCLIAVFSGIFIVALAMLADRLQKAVTSAMSHRDVLFSRIFRNVDEVFMLASGADSVEYVSPNSWRNLHAPAATVLADPAVLYDHFAPEDVDWLRQILNGQVEIETVCERTATMMDTDRLYKIRVYSPITDSETGKKQYIVSFNDQTNIIERQRALKEALEAAHAASAAKSSFLSHMSHEIRTPMNAIIGMTTIAISRIDDKARVEDCLGKISESSRHLLGIINDVLDMSKIESGKLDISHDSFNLSGCVENIANLMRSQTQARQQEFEIQLENVENEELIGDPLRLNQVLLNILSNASKFTPPGGLISLKIQQMHTQNNMTHFRFVIRDTGIGMSEEFLQRIYEPFEQASADTAAKYGGSGLGMPITANLVSLMDGIISVKSREGEGTTFTVELPFEIGSSNDQPDDGLGLLSVLVVDDDPDVCEHACLLLEKMGVRAEWCESGHDAIEMVRSAHDAGEPYNVCLIDWKMPQMDGAATTRRIREVVGDDLMIVIISAYDWEPIADDARQAGANDFIAKPFFISNLHEVLASASQNIKNGAKGIDAATPDAYDFSGKRVLLVEDNEFNREISQEFLEMANLEVENAENGHEAVEKFTSSPPGHFDIVLMDVQMPLMNGYDATRAIRASNHPQARSMCIIAMTANAFNEDVAHAVAAGMNGHIAKPLDVQHLYRVLARYLDTKNSA